MSDGKTLICEPTDVITTVNTMPVRLWRGTIRNWRGERVGDDVRVYVAQIVAAEDASTKTHEALRSMTQEVGPPRELEFPKTLAIDLRQLL